MWHTYLLMCKDKSIYTGITNDLEKRFLRHKEGKGGKYTRSHKVIRLLHHESFRTKGNALKREAEIKKWPRKEKLRLASTNSDDRKEIFAKTLV